MPWPVPTPYPGSGSGCLCCFCSLSCFRDHPLLWGVSSGLSAAERPWSRRRRDAEPCSCPYMSRDKAVLQQAGKTRKSGHKAALCPALCLKSAMTLPRVAKKRRAAGPVPLGTGEPHGYPSSITRSRVGREGACGMLWISLRFLGWGPS